MKFPLPQQYQQALQMPRLSLFDAALRAGSTELDKMGLPRVRSGNFASVYRIFSGSAPYAIKCFLSAPDDIQTRWEQISDCLNSINCDYFLKIQYFARGISVNGQVYPILKMPWQDGITLDKYAVNCVAKQDKQGILAVRGQFLNLYKTLRSYKIAHGDLQHGNILITPEGNLCLIDYDGLYCPSTTLDCSHETGHPNYQHPKRKACHYNELIDTFSAAVIFTALTALAYDLTFWQKYYNGDNLLFCGRDFLNTNQSPLFRSLAAAGDAEVKTLAAAIAASCLCPYEKLPDFSEMLDAAATGVIEPLPLSTHALPREREDLPVQSSVKQKDWIPAFAGMTDLINSAEEVCDQPPSHASPHSDLSPDKVVCPNCNALNEQSAALCMYCGYLLCAPTDMPPPAPPDQPSPEPVTAQYGISFAAKLKWSLLYFILFSLLLAAYDQTDNNRAILQKALAFIEAGKDRLSGRIKGKSGEIDRYSKVIAASPRNATAYLKRGDAYMKAGAVNEAASDYKTAAELAINAANTRLHSYE
ncbi:MAG: hypothetical protein HQK99_13055 [Nitrospirae bacterium]|nr:hypothetical protein [Nitrospirota bacterium]